MQRTAHFVPQGDFLRGVDFASPCNVHCLRLVFALAAPCLTTIVAAVNAKNLPKTEY